MENCGFVRSGAMPLFFVRHLLNPYLLLKVV